MTHIVLTRLMPDSGETWRCIHRKKDILYVEDCFEREHGGVFCTLREFDSDVDGEGELQSLRFIDSFDDVAQKLNATPPSPSQQNAGTYDNTPISILSLSTRSRNVLKLHDIYTVGHLVKHRSDQLLKFRNFHHRSLHDVKTALYERGLCLADEILPPADTRAALDNTKGPTHDTDTE